MPEVTRFRWLRRADDLRYEIKQGNFEAADLFDPLLNRPRWRLMRMTDDATMVGRERRRRLLKLAQQLDADGVEGDFVELGTFKGGTAAVLGRAAAGSPYSRHLSLFDSFEGLPEPRAEDGAEAARYAGGKTDGKTRPIGECVGTREEVEGFLFGPAGLERGDVTLVQGWYQDTLPTAEMGPIALLHLDCDWYESVQLALNALYDDVVPGGCVVLDDYGEWPGASKALHEFLDARGI